MNKLWSDKAWDDYLYWQTQDKKTLKRINELVKDIERNGKNQGIGKPEPLRYRKGWSRRIDEKNRLVYDIDENENILIASCRGHYEYLKFAFLRKRKTPQFAEFFDVIFKKSGTISGFI